MEEAAMMKGVWKHLKRGTFYQALGVASVQAEGSVVEGDRLVVYQGQDGKLWARPETEFLDGRFAQQAEDVNAPVSALTDMALIYRIHLLHNLGDACYAVREREGKGWDGPEVVMYGQLIDELNKRFVQRGIVTLSKEF